MKRAFKKERIIDFIGGNQNRAKGCLPVTEKFKNSTCMKSIQTFLVHQRYNRKVQNVAKLFETEVRV